MGEWVWEENGRRMGGQAGGGGGGRRRREEEEAAAAEEGAEEGADTELCNRDFHGLPYYYRSNFMPSILAIQDNAKLC